MGRNEDGSAQHISDTYKPPEGLDDTIISDSKFEFHDHHDRPQPALPPPAGAAPPSPWPWILGALGAATGLGALAWALLQQPAGPVATGAPGEYGIGLFHPDRGAK